MYWPLGTPRIFSAQVTNLVTTYDSDDNPETGTLVTLSPVDNVEDSNSQFHPLLDGDHGRGGKDPVNSRRKDGPNISNTFSLKTPLSSPQIPRENSSGESKISRSNLDVIFSEETNEQLTSGALLALRMSRNGVLFATLSVNEMTIWQIKVRRAHGVYE